MAVAQEPCPIRIVIRDDDDRDAPPMHDKTGDHNDRYFRDWIVKTTWWALRNRKSVAMYPLDPA